MGAPLAPACISTPTGRPAGPMSSPPPKCNLVCINPDVIMHAWPLVDDFIESAMHKTNLSDFSSVERDVLGGKALLWMAWAGKDIKAAAVTQISKANGHKYCTIIACGGNGREDWLELIHGLEDYAQREGCAAMRIFGRCGWSRVLPDYKIVGHITERTLQ